MALVSWWKLDETSGTSAADSAGANTGTFVGSPAWTAGLQNGGLDFSAQGQYLTIANEANFDFERTNSFSVAAWIRQDNITTGDGQAMIISKLLNAGAFSGWEFSCTDNAGGAGATDTLTFWLRNNAGNELKCYVIDVLSQGVVYHVAVTYAGTSLATGVKMYINGVSQTLGSTGTLSASILNAQVVQIAARSGNSNRFDGLISDVRVYNHVLTQAEVTGLYAAVPTASFQFRHRRS